MSVVVVVVVISSSYAGCGVWKSFFAKFFQKEFFGELIVSRKLNTNFTIFFDVILSDLSKLSLSFKTKS